MKSNTTKKDNNIESSHNDDLNSIEEIEPIDKRFSIYLSMQTKPSKQTEQQHRLALAAKKQKEQDSQTKDSTTSTAFLHPILEDNELKCPHNGVVKLKSNKGKNFKSNNIPMILESDLINSSIIGCTNPLLSGGPCTMVATILPSARALKKYNDDYPIMQDLCISGVMSDKGFPITCTPKSNTLLNKDSL